MTKPRLAALLLILLILSGQARAEIVFSDASDYQSDADYQNEPEGFIAIADMVDGIAAAADNVSSGDPTADPTDAESTEAPLTLMPPATGEDEPWPRRIVITVGGDTTLGCTDRQREMEAGFANIITQMGYAWPFSSLSSLLAQDDLTLVNFEGALTESNDKLTKKFNFKGPAEYAQILVHGSVEAVTLANNHFGDYGDGGKADTKAALSAVGIVYCAPGETAIYEVRGVKIGLIGNTFAYTDGKCDISKDVKALRDAGCQIVVASFHWGSEYEYSFNRDQRNIGRAAIKSGADIVVGHHPHVVQGIEKYEDTYILYSLGNLVFGGNTDPDHRDAYLAQLAFDVYEDGAVDGPELTILPIRTTGMDKGTDYRPVLAEAETRERILKEMLKRSTNMEDFQNPAKGE